MDMGTLRKITEGLPDHAEVNIVSTWSGITYDVDDISVNRDANVVSMEADIGE